MEVFKMASMTRIFGDPILVIEEDEVKSVFPLSLQTLRVSNTIARTILISPSLFGAYDKSSINFSGSIPISLNKAYSGDRLPTKLRPMMGSGRLGAWVKILGANELIANTKRAYSLMVLVGKTGAPLIFMGGNSITDYRTASSAAVGTEALSASDYTVAILGVGSVGKYTAFALQALDQKPRSIVATAKSKKEYGSVRERIHKLGKEWGFPLTPAETIQDAVNGVDVVVDAIAAPHFKPVIFKSAFQNTTTPLVYVDESKQSIDVGLLLTFQQFFVDSKPLARLLPSPIKMFIMANEHETVYDDEFLSIGRAINRTLYDKKCRCYYTIVGVPPIDAALAEVALRRLAHDRQYKPLLEQALPADVLDILYSDNWWFE